ncbi:hypothetical protein QUF50_05600 [Thiotrichales bacterium HSG1]|nr:hypothetical protein [Thiotrichales bacterium HSG1]
MTDIELKKLVANLAISQQKTDEELNKLVANSAISQRKTSEELRRLAENSAICQQKTDAQLAKTDAQLAKTDAQLAKTDAQLAKTDAQLAKTDAQLAKTDAKIDRIATLVGNISNNQGDATEEFFYRSLLDNACLGNMHFDIIDRNLQRHKVGIQDEFDVVLINENNVAIVEIKHKAHPKLINEMLTKKIPNFRALFPYYANLNLYGVIASMVSNNELVTKAKEAGLFFLAQKGQHVVLVNDQAKAF